MSCDSFQIISLKLSWPYYPVQKFLLVIRVKQDITQFILYKFITTKKLQSFRICAGLLEHHIYILSYPPPMAGKLVTRTKLSKPVSNLHGPYYTWKDLNVGMDVFIYGVKYRLCTCDGFTKDFLTCQGNGEFEFEKKNRSFILQCISCKKITSITTHIFQLGIHNYIYKLECFVKDRNV